MSEEQIEPIEVQEYQPSWWQRVFGKLTGNGTPTIWGFSIKTILAPLWGLLRPAALLFGISILAGSSFTFGYDFVGAWLFRGWLGDPISRFLSGVTCVVLFDLTWGSALTSFFNNARSNVQRSAYLAFFFTAFTLGLLATLASLILLAEGVAGIDPQIFRVVQFLGRGAVLVGLVNVAFYGWVPAAVDPQTVNKVFNDIVESEHAEQEQIGQLLMEQAQKKSYYETIQREAYRIGQERGRQAVDDFGNRHRLADGMNGHDRENFPQA